LIKGVEPLPFFNIDRIRRGKKMEGFNGKNLRVDLSTKTLMVERKPEEEYRLFLGGRGFIASTLLRELAPGIDPLGPQNKLIFSLGPMTGHPLIGSARHSVGAKSPLSGCFGESEAGGYWGAELKRAGFDFIIVEGASETPVYLWIKDGQAEIRRADHLWGLGTADTEKAIRDELGEPQSRVACIGPAGEKLVRYACVAHDVAHMAGRTGLGAVMGSKRLKAVAVRGHERPKAHDANALKELSRWMAKNFRERTRFWQCGTGSTMISYEATGNLPIRNFQGGRFANVTKITPQHMMEQDLVEKMEGCFICPVKCKRKVKLKDPWTVDSLYGGPEYETLAAFGSNCGVDQVEALIKANEICNRNGMDTISAGVAISFAMECFERGILTKEQTGGLELRFGNAEAMLEMVEQIASRRALGDILAEGVKRASEKIGGDASMYAMHVKGCEIPMHEPRSKHGMALHYSVHGTGPDHCAGIHDDLIMKNLKDWDRVDVAEPIPPTEMSPRKARMLYQTGLWRQVGNYLGLCLFIPWTQSQLCEAAEAVTGWPMSHWRLMKTVERGLTLARVFNIREGFSLSDDILPERFFTTTSEGPLNDVAINREAFFGARNAYYQMLGWDEKGVPTSGRLAELAIEWAEAYLDRQG